MISQHDNSNHNKGQAAANQAAQSKTKRAVMQARATDTDNAEQSKTYQEMAYEHIFTAHPQKGVVQQRSENAAGEPAKRGRVMPAVKSGLVTQLLKAKGKGPEIEAAAKRCKFDPEDPALEDCWNAASTLLEFRTATASAEAFTQYESSMAPAAAAPVVAAPVFAVPGEAEQRAQFALEAAKVNWKAGHPLAAANFSGSEIRESLPHIVKIMKHAFHQANGTATMEIRQEKNAALGDLAALFETVKDRMLALEAEAIRDHAFSAGKQVLLALPAVQGNAIVLDVVTRLQRSGNMATSVVPGTHSRAAINTAITVWLSLIPQLPAVITNINVPGDRVIKRKLRGVEGGGQVFDYNKNLICHADNNPNNFHINADPALVAAIEAAPGKEVVL